MLFAILALFWATHVKATRWLIKSVEPQLLLDAGRAKAEKVSTLSGRSHTSLSIR